MSHIHLAGCVIQDEQDRFLMLHRNTPELKQWEIPGGKLDPGEDAPTTAARELREEMGIEVAVGRWLGERSFDQDGRTMVYTWYLATITSGEPTVRECDLHDDYAYLRMAQLEEMFDELSPNAKNFVDELKNGRITL